MFFKKSGTFYQLQKKFLLDEHNFFTPPFRHVWDIQQYVNPPWRKYLLLTQISPEPFPWCLRRTWPPTTLTGGGWFTF